MRRQGGFTLIELMVTFGLIAIMMVLGAVAVRQFWLRQSLEGATDRLVTVLRGAQEDARSQSAPLVFGIGPVAGSSTYNIYRFDPKGAGTVDDECTVQVQSFESGLFNASVNFQTITVTNDPTAPEFVKCDSLVPGTDKIIFFYARGSSTGGSMILQQPVTEGTRTVVISAATGRVTTS